MNTTSAVRITRVAAYGLITDANRIVLCRLAPHARSHGGRWTLPGGGLDFGEDPADAVVREVKEETGLDVAPIKIAGIDTYVSNFGERVMHSIRILYHVKLLGGQLKNEVDGSTDLCAWWTEEESRALPLVNLTPVGLNYAFPNDA